MDVPDPDPFERTGQTLPVSPGRRNARRTLGCLFLVIILSLLLWFGLTHTSTGKERGFLGWELGSGWFTAMLAFT
jgi:hypothetical protein